MAFPRSPRKNRPLGLECKRHDFVNRKLPAWTNAIRPRHSSLLSRPLPLLLGVQVSLSVGLKVGAPVGMPVGLKVGVWWSGGDDTSGGERLKRARAEPAAE